MRAGTRRTCPSGDSVGTGPPSSRKAAGSSCPHTRAARDAVRRASGSALHHRRGRSSERPTSTRADAATHTARVARSASPWNARRSRGTPHATAPGTRRGPSPNARRVRGCSGRVRRHRRTHRSAPQPRASPRRTTNGSHGAVKSRRGPKSTSTTAGRDSPGFSISAGAIEFFDGLRSSKAIRRSARRESSTGTGPDANISRADDEGPRSSGQCWGLGWLDAAAGIESRGLVAGTGLMGP